MTQIFLFANENSALSADYFELILCILLPIVSKIRIVVCPQIKREDNLKTKSGKALYAFARVCRPVLLAGDPNPLTV